MTTYTQTLPKHFITDALDRATRVTNPARDYPYGAEKFMAQAFGDEFKLNVSADAPKPSNVVSFKTRRLAA